MKRELMDILACPICKGDLELDVTEETDEIITGTLDRGWYPKHAPTRPPRVTWISQNNPHSRSS
jgi:hypothetical protein